MIQGNYELLIRQIHTKQRFISHKIEKLFNILPVNKISWIFRCFNFQSTHKESHCTKQGKLDSNAIAQLDYCILRQRTATVHRTNGHRGPQFVIFYIGLFI